MTDKNKNPYRDWSHSEHTDEWLQNRLEQCSKPQGEAGVELAHKMNKEHSTLVAWALDTYLNSSKLEAGRCLDIGCGGGATLKALHSRYPTLDFHGIDYSSDMVELAALETSGFASIKEGSVSKLPYKADYFDLITAVETTYFWPNLLGSFENTHKVLKEGCKFIIIQEMYDDPENHKYKERNHRMLNLASLNLFTPEGLKELLSEAGFRDITFTTLPENNWICYQSTK